MEDDDWESLSALAGDVWFDSLLVGQLQQGGSLWRLLAREMEGDSQSLCASSTAI